MGKFKIKKAAVFLALRRTLIKMAKEAKSLEHGEQVTPASTLFDAFLDQATANNDTADLQQRLQQRLQNHNIGALTSITSVGGFDVNSKATVMEGVAEGVQSAQENIMKAHAGLAKQVSALESTVQDLSGSQQRSERKLDELLSAVRQLVETPHVSRVSP